MFDMLQANEGSRLLREALSKVQKIRRPNDGKSKSTYSNLAVRRLTPKEAERLQGFPDNFTNIPWRGKDTSPDGRRYKALGNSMAVNVMRWLGERIQTVENISDKEV